MNETIKRLNNSIPQAFELLYLSCLFFITFEIAVPLPVSIFKGLYIALFLALLLRVVLLREGFKLLLPPFMRTGMILLPFFLLLGYLAWDVAGLFYSPDAGYAARKYYVVVPMLAFIIPTISFAQDEDHLDRLYRTLGWSGAAVGLFSLSNYFIYEFVPLPYIRRLSMITDYNRYAENLFIAMVLMGFYIINTTPKRTHRTAKLTFALIFFATLITLSGSRRTYLLMFPSIAALLLYRSFYIVRYSATERMAFYRLCKGLVLSVIAAAAVMGLQAGFEWYSDIKYEIKVEQGGEVIEETSVDTVIDSISSGGMFGKRAVIWRTAVNDALEFDFLDILIGRGSGYDSYLYDHTSDPNLAAIYANIEPKPKNWMNPHNFVLADFLNGGLIRILLSFTLAASVGATLWAVFIRRANRAVSLFLAMAFVYFSAFISGRYGFVYDKFYYILLACLVAEHALALRARPNAPKIGR